MGFADIHEELVDQPSNQLSLSVDPCNQLRDHLKPRVDVDGADAFNQRFVDLGPVSVIEPQREEPKSILQRTAVRQGNRFEESLHARNCVK